MDEMLTAMANLVAAFKNVTNGRKNTKKKEGKSR